MSKNQELGPNRVPWPLSADPISGREPMTDKTHVVSTRRWVLTNCVSGRTLQPSTEPVVADSSLPSDFLVEGQVSVLGTAHPLLTLNIFSTWFLPLQKRKKLSSIIGRTPEEEEKILTHHLVCIFFSRYCLILLFIPPPYISLASPTHLLPTYLITYR